MTQKDAPSDKVPFYKSRTFWLSLLITIGALMLAGLHLFLPAIELDAITLGLLIMAVVPWLGPIFKSIELPGGIKLELREEIRELRNEITEQLEDEEEKRREIAERVQQVEHLFFKGAEIKAQEKDDITLAVEEFDTNLKSLGAEYGAFPKVMVLENLPPEYQAHYDPDTNELVISKDWVHDLDVVRREFCFRAFHKPLIHNTVGQEIAKLATEGTAFAVGSIISGFGYYFPCSFKNNPIFGSQNVPILDARHLAYHDDVDTPTEDMARLLKVTARGERWAHSFWEIRENVDHKSLDRALISAWGTVPKSLDIDNFDHLFVSALAEQLETMSNETVQSIAQRWGLLN